MALSSVGKYMLPMMLKLSAKLAGIKTTPKIPARPAPTLSLN